MPLVEQAGHQRPLDPKKGTICYGGRRCHAQLLTRQAALAEELTGVQYRDDCFLATTGCNRKLHLASPEIEQGIRRSSLAEDVAARTVLNDCLTACDSREEGFPIDWLVFLVRQNNPRLPAKANRRHH